MRKNTSNILVGYAAGRWVIPLVLLAAALIAAGVGGVIVAFLPFEHVRPWLNSMSIRGDAHVSAEKWTHVARLMIFPCLLCVAAGLGMLADVRRLADVLAQTAERLGADCKSLGRQLFAGLRADGAVTLLLLGAITLAGLAARLHYINQPIRHDEAWTFLVFSMKPTIAAWSSNYEPNNHILNTLLVRSSYLIFGSAELALRLPALIAGTILIPMTYLGFRRIVRREAAIVAAAFVASNSYLVEYGALARGYSLVCLATVTAVGLAETVRRERNLFAWCALATVMVIGFFSVPIMLYPFAGIAGWLALSAAMERVGYTRKVFVRDLAVFCAASGILTLWLYLPVFIVSGIAVDVAKDISGNAHTLGWADQLVSRAQSFWALVNRDVPGALQAIFALAALGGIAGSIRNWRVRPPILPVMVAMALILTIAQHMVGYDRIWTYLIPFYAAAIGCTVAWAVRWLGQPVRLPIAGTVAAVLCGGMLVAGVRSRSIFYSDEGGAFPQAKQMAEALVPVTDGNSLVFAKCPLEFPTEYYLRRLGNPLQVNAGAAHGTVYYVAAPRDENYRGPALQHWLQQCLAVPQFVGTDSIICQYGPATLHRVDLPQTSDAELAAERGQQ